MTTKRTNSILSMLFLSTALSGCKAREMGIGFSSTEARNIDPTWVIAAKNCWPALGHAGYSTEGLSSYLGDPLHFRAVFGVYASLTDSQIESVVAQPITAAPYPDHESLLGASTPILTIHQAVAGAAPVQTTPGTVPPADALCAVHPGKPVGFK